ncbi:hypothetical protein OSB04_029120 [Centaurea solstitialis]|uniref:Uncharacterized protein n=1 Tax=Centaurea solstitialis TaxID=347529 RepID=A0AA38W9Z3_9ASTR|nr:hypothetical protein OSB04_029120 [Centaurea solstitialis]
MDSQDSVLVSKVPMLKPNEFEMWKIRIKQYMLLTDYALWEVVEHGPSVPEPAVAGAPPKSDADKKRKQTEMKALSTLLLAIPNEYQHQFCTCPDAKSLWNALEKRFSGTKSSKRNQKALLKQQYENFTSTKNESMTQTFDRFNKLIGELANVDVKMEKDEVNRKFLRSLSEEWTMYTVSFRQGDDLEDKELEDLYNDLRIFEAEVEAKRRPTGYSHTIALYSSENPSSNINTASTTNINPANNNHDSTNDKSSVSQDTNGDAVLEAFLANHVRSPLINDDLEQINADDLEEMDIKWKMAMLTMRMKRFIRRTGRNKFDAKRGDLAGFDKSKVRCYKCNEPGHFARECKGSGTHQQANNGGQAYVPRPNRGNNSNSSQALVSQEGMGFDWSDQAEEAIQNHALMAKITEPELPAEKELEKAKEDLDKFSKSSKALEEILKAQVHDELKRGIGYHNTPPPRNHTYIPPTTDILDRLNREELKEGVCDVDPSSSDDKEEQKGKTESKSQETVPEENQILTNEKGGMPYVPSKNATVSRKGKEKIVDQEPATSKPSAKSGKSTHKNDSDPEDVYYVDQLRYNLMSVSQVCDKKLFTLFSETECMILSPKFVIDESFILLRTPRKDNVYCLDLNGMPSEVVNCLFSKTSMTESSLWHRRMGHMNIKTMNLLVKNQSEVVNCLFSKASMTESSLWHRRMGHMNIKTMNLLVKNQLVRGLPPKEFTLDDNCVACLKGKQHKASHKSKTINTISAPLQLLHMDLFGPTNVMSIGKKSYCLVIIDDYSRFTWVFFLRTKDETSGLIKPFVKRVENQVNLRVKVIRSDNGTEFKNADLNSFCEEKGIERQFSAPRTPQLDLNGVAERRNRTLIEAARTMLADSKLPITFWAEAVNTACYVQNRVHVVKSKGKTPYELFKNKKPFIGFFVPFGCPCSILNTKTHLGKFDSKADDGFFVGYSIQSKAVRVFNTVSRTIEESDNVKFNEHTPNVHGTGPDWLFDIDSLTNSLNMSNAVDAGPIIKEKETDTPFVLFPPSTIKHQEGDKETEETPQLESNVENEPGDTSEITQPDLSESDPDDSNLGESLSEEPLHLTRTQKNHPASQVIGDVASPMITRKQSREAGYVNTHSGMLSCFLSQNEPKKVLDAMKDPSWIEAMQEELLQFVLQHVWDLVDLPKGHRVIGTKWIFRNKTDERGIVIKNKARLVAQGYTQEEGIDYDDVFAPVARIEAIRLFLAFASYKGFKVYQMDVKSAFLYGTIDEEVYVCQPPGFEDPKYPDRVCKLRKALYGLHQAPRAWYDTLSSYLLENKFERGVIDKTLFIKRTKTDMLLVQIYVKQKGEGIFINQSKYVATMLQKFGMNDAKPASTPMETHKHLTADVEGEEVDVHQYRSMIGSLMYLTASRPDIMFAVCVCARFQVRPKESHLHAVKRIFKYLKGQQRLGLWYPYDNSFDLVAYTDSDYGGANLDRKSHQEDNQMQDYGLSFLQTPIYIDNNSAISIVNNPVKHSKTKHIDIKYHLIRDCNEKKLIQVLKVHTDDQYADRFTKAFDVGRWSFRKCTSSEMEFSWVIYRSQCSNLRSFLHRLQKDSLRFVKDHNKIGYLSKGGDSEGFEDIVDFLASSYIAYAATINPTVYIQHMQDFWSNAVVQEEEGVKSIQTTICGLSLTLTPAKIRHHLQLNDEGGISMLSTRTIMENLLKMGYTGSKTSLKYLKGKLCPQWRFFVHTLLHCFSEKTTGFGEFSSPMASALVCLATNQMFNFSQMIFDDLVYNLENIPNSKVKTFFMFPRFVQEVITKELTAVPTHGDIYKSSALGHKVFSNMKRPVEGSNDQFTPLFPKMMRVNQPQGEASGLQPTQSSIPSDDLPTPVTDTIPLSLEKTPTPTLQKYQRKNRGAPSSSGSKPQEPISQQLEHSPSDSTQRDTPGVQPTQVPRNQGASSASARLKTKVKKLKDPVMEVNTSKPGEGRFSQQELMENFRTIAKDLKAFEKNFFVHDEKHGSHAARLDTLEELATAQHDMLKLHEAQLVKQAKVIQAQGASIASIKDVEMETEAKGEEQKETGTGAETSLEVNEETQVADEPVADVAKPEINEDDLTIAKLLVKLPEVIKPTKGVVFKEPEVVKQIDLSVDSKSKGKEKVIEQAESDSDTEIDEAKRKIMEYEASEALARKLSLEEQERVNKEVEERKKKAEKKKPVKKEPKKTTPKAETEKRRTMVRYLSSALGKPVQYFSRWTLKEIENKYHVTREAMHLEALEEQQVETEDVALVQRKRKRDQSKEQVTTEGNPETGVEKAEETVANTENQVVQIIEKKEEVERKVEVPKQIEAQPSKVVRKKSVAKKPKTSKEVEEPSNISMWIFFENNQMDYFKIFRSDGTSEVFANHLGIFRKLSKGDLKKMYEIACTKEVEDFEEARMLVEDLKLMFAFSKTKAELKEKGKRDQDDSIGEGKVISWNTYENRVFSVNFEKGRMSFFLMDKRYYFEPIMMGSMLEVKKKSENLSEFDKELIGRLREQLLELNAHYFDEEVIELKQKKVIGWGVDQDLRYVVQFDDGSELCDAEWENVLDECTRENLKEMYEHRCTVIKVAVNDRDNPDQAKKRKFALECLFWLFEPFRLLGVKSSTCEDLKVWRWFEKCRVYSLSINDEEMEYYFEECETDALDIQRLQGMMKVSLSTKGEPTRAARLLVKKMHTYLKIRLTNLAPHAEKLSLGGDC